MGPLGFFIDLSFRPHYDTGVNLTSKRNEYQEYLLDSKGGRCVWLTLPPSCADFLGTVGASTSWSPTGLCRPVTTTSYHHWLDSPWWSLAFLRSFTHSSPSRATFFQFLTFGILISWSTPSSQRIFGLPTLLTPSSLVLNIFFYSSIVVHTHQLPCPCQSFNFDVIDNVWIIKYFV